MVFFIVVNRAAGHFQYSFIHLTGFRHPTVFNHQTVFHHSFQLSFSYTFENLLVIVLVNGFSGLIRSLLVDWEGLRPVKYSAITIP